MVHVTNRPNVAMRLRAFEFLLGHLLFSGFSVPRRGWPWKASLPKGSANNVRRAHAIR
jgi:hypothetical protein